MELSIRALNDQVKILTSQLVVAPYHLYPTPQSEGHPPTPMDTVSNWRQMTPIANPDTPPSPLHSVLTPDEQLQEILPTPISPQHQPLQQLQMPPFQAQQPAPPRAQSPRDTPTEDWEKVFLQVFSSPDSRTLIKTLAHCPAEQVMPLDGPLLVSQTVLLSIIHKVCSLRSFPASC